jgi:hypothetical protein
MAGLGKTVSFAAVCLLAGASIAIAPSRASAKPSGGLGGGSGKSSGWGGSTGKGRGSSSWGGYGGSNSKSSGSSSWSSKGSSSGKSSSGSKSGSSGKSSSGSPWNSTAKSGKSGKQGDHHDHDHDYAHDHDHDHDFYHHHHPYYGGFPVIIGGDVVSGGYVESVDPCVDTVGPALVDASDPAPVGAPQVYTVYFKDRSGNPQTYGQFDPNTEGDRLAQTQDRLTAAGVAWWTVDGSGVQVDTDIN